MILYINSRLPYCVLALKQCSTLACILRNVYYFNMCYRCGTPLKFGEKPGFNDVCPTCGADLHVCRMCRFYTPGVHWDCKETVDEQVVDKEKRNHCDYFMVMESFVKESPTGGSAANADAKRRFNALFGE